MVLSETEAERRLAALRREREALDRAITDLTLYLELGRRLTGGLPAADPGRADDDPVGPVGMSSPSSVDRIASSTLEPTPSRPSVTTAAGSPASARDRPGPIGPAESERERSDATECEAAETKSAPGHLSEGALARRYGRALIREAVAVLEEAGRPLHVGEILAALTARGFTIPGQQDPIAALNTRLWKRSGPDGPVRRLGDAMYALAEGGVHSQEDGTRV